MRRPAGKACIHYLPPTEQRTAGGISFRKKLREGRQGYVIVPLVDGLAVGGARRHVLTRIQKTTADPDDGQYADGPDGRSSMTYDLESTFEALANGELEAFRLGLVHGRHDAGEKTRRWRRFAAARRKCSWPPRWSKSASTCRTPR